MKDSKTSSRKQRLFIFIINAVLFFTMLLGCAQAIGQDNTNNAEQQVWIPGCYSDMYYNEEGGDLLGTEIFIVYSRDGFYALYQASEGDPDAPQLLPVKADGAAISFTVPSRGAYGEFNGAVTPYELTGTFLNTDNHISLKRKNSYWQ